MTLQVYTTDIQRLGVNIQYAARNATDKATQQGIAHVGGLSGSNMYEFLYTCL
ncbi:unnamed protein product [Alternaria alternata]